MIPSVDDNGEESEPSHTASHWEMAQLPWKAVWQFLKKLNPELLYDSAIPLLDKYLREMKTHPHRNLCVNSCIIH
jgi:hypothetical protein